MHELLKCMHELFKCICMSCLSVYMSCSSVCMGGSSVCMNCSSVCMSCSSVCVSCSSICFGYSSVWRDQTPKGGQGCLMSTSCLESQGCHLIPLSYLLSCFFSAWTSCSFCPVVFLSTVHSPDFFTQKILQHYSFRDRFFVWIFC